MPTKRELAPSQTEGDDPVRSQGRAWHCEQVGHRHAKTIEDGPRRRRDVLHQRGGVGRTQDPDEGPVQVAPVGAVWSRDRDRRRFDAITVSDPFEDRYATGFPRR